MYSKLFGISEDKIPENPQDLITTIRERFGLIDTRTESVTQAFDDVGGGWGVSSVRSPGGQQIQLAISSIRGDSPGRFEEDSGLESSQSADDVEVVAVGLQESMAREQEIWRDLAGSGGTLRLYRGINTFPPPDKGATQTTDLPASSWTINPKVAQGFGITVIARDVAIEDIIGSTFGHNLRGGEDEFIVYTPSDGSSAEVL